MSGGKDDNGFANRWSRLKQQAKDQQEEPVAEGPEAEGPVASFDDDTPDEEVLDALGLPDPDTMKPGDDFMGFMAKAVPARLRNRALRRLWISNPVLANLDELIDYGEDFTDAATVIDNLQTGYEAGKGWAGKAAELAKQDALAAEQAAAEKEEIAVEPAEAEGSEAGESGADAVVPGDDTLQNSDAPEDAVPEAKAEREVDETPISEPDGAPALHSRQRMRFRVAEE